MTNGGQVRTSGGGRGGWRSRYAAPWLLFALVAAAQAAVNAVSSIADRSRMGRPVPSWEPLSWEGTSLLAWLLLVPLIFAIHEWSRPSRLGWPRTIAFHLISTVIASLAHVTLMVVGREVIYAVQGSDYRFSFGGEFLYEYRKDLLTYAVILGCFILFERLKRPAPEPAPKFQLEVRDGTRTHWIDPQEIDWAQAAGNYVELSGSFGTILHRQTLAALADALQPHGFARIHRSRLVRKDGVAAVDARPSGDFDVLMRNGAKVGGSRRYRDQLGR